MHFAATLLTIAAGIGAPGSGQSGATAIIAAASLPSGSSEEFRAHMIEWNSPPQSAPVLTRERPAATSAARLDRLAISSRFGWRSDPVTGIGRHHAGIDLPSRFGAAVAATAPGVVRIARWAGGYGNLVEIEHRDGVRTRYGHLSRLEVVPNQHVAEGQLIGEVGSTGHSTGPHLHFEVRVGGMAVDPLSFVGQRAPAVETVWGADLHAMPRWAWRTGSLDETLPEVSLR